MLQHLFQFVLFLGQCACQLVHVLLELDVKWQQLLIFFFLFLFGFFSISSWVCC